MKFYSLQADGVYESNGAGLENISTTLKTGDHFTMDGCYEPESLWMSLKRKLGFYCAPRTLKQFEVSTVYASFFEYLP